VRSAFAAASAARALSRAESALSAASSETARVPISFWCRA
jgi:hypothetical protein